MSDEDKKWLGYTIWSIQLIYKWTGKKDFEAFEEDVKTQDAICTRLFYIGKAYSMLSQDTKGKISKTDASDVVYFVHEYFHEDAMLWDLIKGWEYITSLKSYIKPLEDILFNRLNNNEKKGKGEGEDLSTDYEYPIKTYKSIWTVKNK